MSLKTRLAALEQSAGINDQSAKQVILLADVDDIGETAAVERWKAGWASHRQCLFYCLGCYVMNRSIMARLAALEKRKAAESKQSDAIDNAKAWLARILAELEAAKKQCDNVVIRPGNTGFFATEGMNFIFSGGWMLNQMRRVLIESVAPIKKA